MDCSLLSSPHLNGCLFKVFRSYSLFVALSRARELGKESHRVLKRKHNSRKRPLYRKKDTSKSFLPPRTRQGTMWTLGRIMGRSDPNITVSKEFRNFLRWLFFIISVDVVKPLHFSCLAKLYCLSQPVCGDRERKPGQLHHWGRL